MKLVEVMEKYMLPIVFSIMILGVILGMYYHHIFVTLKITLPLSSIVL